MAEVKWVKLTTDMFDNRKVKYLRKLPDGNSKEAVIGHYHIKVF